jgi:hypothetical protein
MVASHALLRQMMLSLELWLLSCWLYLYNRWIRSPPFLARSTVICNHKIGLKTTFEMIWDPRISWFLVPKGCYEMRASWIPRTVFSIKPKNGSNNFLKSPFFANFREISIFESQNTIVKVYFDLAIELTLKHAGGGGLYPETNDALSWALIALLLTLPL